MWLLLQTGTLGSTVYVRYIRAAGGFLALAFVTLFVLASQVPNSTLFDPSHRFGSFCELTLISMLW